MQFPIRLITTTAALFALTGAGLAHAEATSSEFQSPSGNIECIVGNTGAACEIANHDYVSPARPAECHLAYGDRVSLDASGVRFNCHGDRLVGSTAVILPYGASITEGPFTCVSTVDYVQCTGYGHMFRLSRQAYDIG